MDICRFLNSRDVADYLREIGYKFSAPEAAFIVYRSREATLDEKIASWREIADTMPDCSMEGRLNMESIPDFRTFLYEYIGLQKRTLAWFSEPSGCVYGFSYPSDEGWEQDGNIFCDAESCLEHIRSCCGGRWDQEEAPLRYAIEKRPVNQPDSGKSGTMLLNASLEALAVDCAHLEGADLDLSLQFDGMWFAIPTPFKRGDFVCDACDSNAQTIVVDSLPSWGRKDYIDNGFPESDSHASRADAALDRFMKDGDTTDMNAYGFFADENGDVWCERTGCNYLDLRYQKYVGGPSRWALVVSAFLDGQLNLCAAWNSLHYLRVDSDARNLKQKYGRWIPEWYRFNEDTRMWTRD